MSLSTSAAKISHAHEEDADPKYKWKVLIAVMFGIFMIILDSTVVNVAFQTLRNEFGRPLADTQWVLSIYVLALGITTPVTGYLGDRFGTKYIYLIGLAMFAFGSLLCGIAPTLPLLIAARALQGIGGGLAQPLSAAMLYRAFPMREIGKALGIFGIVLTVAPALGPILGGLLVDANLWRAIFFLNLPVGITGVFLGLRFLKNDKAAVKPAFDPLGLVLAVVGFGSVLYAASVAESSGWADPSTLSFFAVGVVSLIAFAIVELKVVKEPLLNLRLFGKRVFLNATLIGYVATVALFGAEFLMPVYLQALRGRTALEAGMTLLAVAAASAITTPLAGRLYDKIGPRPLVVVGFALLCVNTWQLAQLEALTPITTILGLLFIRGLAVGLTLQTTFTTALGAVPREQLARGSSLQNSTRFVVQALAVAALATVLTSSLSPAMREQQEKAREAAPMVKSTARFGICETPGVAAEDNVPESARAALAGVPEAQRAAALAKIRAGLQTICDENIQGFENTYRITFYASLVALLLGLFLPGWPAKWAGRSGQQGAPPAPSGGH
ncbi:MAG: DHA2 family efflux MFS transporter permease subunit [Chloroflexi bacterium]|nr:DHA2 family efflux MFS transporter permease subunit [Chloroflexota bacterium]